MKKVFVFSFILLIKFSFAQINVAKLDSFISLLNEHNKAMGSFSVYKEGKPLYSKAIGFIDSNKTIATNAETKIRIGSISKMYTAVMIFQLVEENKLSLETTLDKFYKEIPNSSTITILNLLQQRTGLSNYTDDSVYTLYGDEKKSKEWFINLFKNYKSEFAPNSKHEYSNTNYQLLSYIIEKVTKKSFAQNLEERIVKKLNVKNTIYANAIDNKNNQAYSFQSKSKKWVLSSTNTHESWLTGAGGIEATPADLNIFIEALFGGKLINEKHLQLMQEIKDGYGCGMIKLPFGSKWFYGHTGGVDGFNSCLGYNQEDKISIAVCCNGMNYNFNDILIAMLSCTYDVKNYKLPKFEKEKDIDFDISKATGTYSTALAPIKFIIAQKENTLTAQVVGQQSFPLEYKGEGNFEFAPAGVKIKFNIEKGEMYFSQNGMDITFTKEK